jgi:hypothetical protein
MPLGPIQTFDGLVLHRTQRCRAVDGYPFYGPVFSTVLPVCCAHIDLPSDSDLPLLQIAKILENRLLAPKKRPADRIAISSSMPERSNSGVTAFHGSHYEPRICTKKALIFQDSGFGS